MGATLDKAAAQLVDLVELINGVTSPTQFIAGKDVSDWVKNNSAGGHTEKPAAVSAAELAQRLGSFDPKAMAPYVTGPAKAHTGPKAAQHRARMKALETAGKLGQGNPLLMQKLGKLKGSAIEAKMVDPRGPAVRRLQPEGRAHQGHHRSRLTVRSRQPGAAALALASLAARSRHASRMP